MESSEPEVEGTLKDLHGAPSAWKSTGQAAWKTFSAICSPPHDLGEKSKRRRAHRAAGNAARCAVVMLPCLTQPPAPRP
jgi:hypothetical protein